MDEVHSNSNGLFSKIGKWIDDYKEDIVGTGIIIGVVGAIGVGFYGINYMARHSGEVRSEKIIEASAIGKGNEVVTYKRNIKFLDDNYRWEMRDKDSRVFLEGNGFVKINAAYFVSKADSLDNELEKKMND